jgi:EH_Signature domain
VALRHWLFTQFTSLNDALAQTAGARIPAWFGFLGNHVNLLTASPCEVYGIALARGSGEVLQEVRTGLAIPQESWLWEEAVLTRVKHVVRLADAPFQESLDGILSVVICTPEFRISPRLSARCVALLVSRYARCTSRLECVALRDAAIASIGNPWLRRQAWDAYVLDAAGRPDTAARELILSWLRRGLIKDFFELLSEDRAAEQRRLQFWLRFEPVIEDMWFILGAYARKSYQAEYKEFRTRAQGRVLGLCGQTPPTNNAFVMRIGGSLAVEFDSITTPASFLPGSNCPKR